MNDTSITNNDIIAEVIESPCVSDGVSEGQNESFQTDLQSNEESEASETREQTPSAAENTADKDEASENVADKDEASDKNGSLNGLAPLSECEELDALRGEVDELRRKLAESRAIYDRMHAECAEFSELYPNVSLSSLPDEIWESVRNGVPIAAAYALEARRASVVREKALQKNSDNRAMSSGAISTAATEDYFSPAEVRSMSSEEVRANYSKIINSMSKWH